MSIIPTKMEKCKGAMISTAIGDALGWPNEKISKNVWKNIKVKESFIEWKRRSNKPYWHEEKILSGEYSDDTQLTLAISRSIITGNWEKFFIEKELPFWLNYERGGGVALLKAAKSCQRGQLLWQSKYIKDYFEAGGNGAMMRILPHVIANEEKSNIEELMIDIIKDTLITHGHPRAFLGATCYAYALNYLLNKEDILDYGELITAVINGKNYWSDIPIYKLKNEWFHIIERCKVYNFGEEWEKVCKDMLYKLEKIKGILKRGLMLNDAEVLTELGCFSKAKGAGDVTILSAIYLASKYASNPLLGIKVSAFLFGADTDTIASITGGLLGMLNGMDWIPKEWKKVQDYECFLQITELLRSENRKEATRREILEIKDQSKEWKSTPIGKMRLIECKEYLNSKGKILIEKWKSMLGQTIYIKSIYSNKIIYPIEDKNLILQKDFYKDLKNKDKNIIEKEKYITLNLINVLDLLNDVNFKKNITVGKTLKIIRDIMKDDKSIEILSKKYKVEKTFIQKLNQYIR